MNDEKKPIKLSHNLILKDRKVLVISGVIDVDSFDEHKIIVYTDLGELTICGEDIHIEKINLETGDLNLDGNIASMVYTENRPSNQGLFSKLFR